MNPNSVDVPPPEVPRPPGLGIPGALVFDDEPLDGLLYGAEPIAPTPANVLELWEQGLDRSEACARAVAAVLVQNPDAIDKIHNLDAAEHCLRLAIESKPKNAGASMAAGWCGLGRILELKSQKDEAEACYRHALELQKNARNTRPETTEPIARRLIELLENSNRRDEARPLRNRLVADRLANTEDEASLTQLRSMALDMFLAGQYAEAESVYRRLVEKRFELPSTHCHLARVLLMMDREADARREVEQAWAVRTAPPAYLLVRIQFLRTLLQMLAGGERKTCLVEFRNALSQPGAYADWTMQPVLDYLKPRLGSESFELLTAMLGAIRQEPKLAELEASQLWKDMCRGSEADATASQ